jgi:hypothetical protein
MSDINVRSDAVDVEQIMRQIRARIREKRGADYTEAELQQLATAKLERFLDPGGLRSDLVQHFRQKTVPSPPPPNYEFEADTIYETHRGLLRTLRNLFRPLLKLFFNPDRITAALHLQAQINTQGEERLRRLEEREPLSYELLHNLTVELTRLGIEVHNLKMRVESLSSRLDFDELRARALEGVVQYRKPLSRPTTSDNAAVPASTADAPSESDGGASDRRRRRRRRRRRPGSTMADGQGAGATGHDGGGIDDDQGDFAERDGEAPDLQDPDPQ